MPQVAEKDDRLHLSDEEIDELFSVYDFYHDSLNAKQLELYAKLLNYLKSKGLQ